MPSLRRAWYAFVRAFVRETFFRATGGLLRVGTENVPKAGGLIVAPLHVSHVDPPAVACTCPRHLRFMSKEELFRGIFGKIIASVGAFPVKRGEGDTEAVRQTIAMLQNGEAVLVFPEGRRGDGERIQPIERGVGMLAKRTGAFVIPVGIIGSQQVLPKGASKPRRHPIKVAYGVPFRYDDIAPGASEKERREAFAQELQARILALCQENGMPLKSEHDSELPLGSRSRETAP